ncbi:hypothetical protein JXA56_05565 [Candidatus Micrarchaeota archaeon]|nr:hypothetical protein [Candidatus Micrarchaeota archaeon]
MADDSKLFASLSYLIPVLGGVAVFVIKKGEYERFHAMQSIIFWVAAILVSTLIEIAGAIFGLVPVVGGIADIFIHLIRLLFGLGILILWLMLMWKAFIGEKLELPLISEYSRKMKEKAAKSI